MGGIRDFAANQQFRPPDRTLDNAAPDPLRQELLATVYNILPRCRAAFDEDHLYYGIEQMLGVQAAGNPMAGKRQRLGRDLANTDWMRVYDVICWLWSQFQRVHLADEFTREVNQSLAAHRVVWELAGDGRLRRVLPAAAQAQVTAAALELADPNYQAASLLFSAARDAYDDRPRRDRDACGNMFDALESVAKIKYGRPQETFGQVKNWIQQNDLLRREVIDAFAALNDLRNRYFGHGMIAAFALSPAEVDFVYLNCVASILLLRRSP